MDKVATVYYDGEVFRPDGPVNLEPNAHYVISIVNATKPPGAGTVAELLRELAGSIEGPPDWSAEHDHYIHGTARRDEGPTS